MTLRTVWFLLSVGIFCLSVEAGAQTIPESEPNNTFDTATWLTLSPTAIATGAINPGGDVDFYKFTAPAGSRVWIETDTGGTQNAGANSRNTLISLIPAVGPAIESDDDDGTGNGGDGTIETGQASMIAGRTLVAGGTYFVFVQSGATAIVNPYRLFVYVSTMAATPEVEANNTAATATVASAPSLRAASIGVAGDADYYAVVANAGDTIFFQADGDPERDGVSTDLVVEFRDPADALLLTVDSSVTGSPTDPSAEGANFTVAAAGTYFVKVRHAAAGTGTYDLMIVNTADRTESFVNPTPILVPGSGPVGPAFPYPSSIGVSGFVGRVAKVTVTLREINHPFPDDIDVLLVGPGGQKILLMSDAGGSPDLTGQTYTFDSLAAASLSDSPFTATASGTFLPTNIGAGDTFPAPAPAGPYTTTSLAAFNGTDPNGAWSLYVVDDFGTDIGNIAAGWELAITAAPTATSDFNGDGISELALYRPSTGTWFVTDGQAALQFGLPTDVPVAGDYNGDGTIDRAVYRPSSGTWFVHGQGFVQFGAPGDIPVPGDYNGDEITDRAVYRRSNGTWIVQGMAPVQWGLPGDIPVPGDYDGDMVMDFAVYRPSTGWWFVQGQGDVQHGLPGDIPVAADYTGDGAMDRAVYRPSTGTWFVQGLPSKQWGLPGDIPVPSNVAGDTRADFSVYRPSEGTWYAILAEGSQTVTTTFGLPGDIPVPNSPVAYVMALRSTLATQSRVSDFDGDRLSDLTVFRPSSATWFTRRSTTDFATSASVQWGLSGDVPVPGDYDGDGQTDFAVYRPSTAGWHFLRSSSGYTTSTTISWGLSGDVAVPGDYDGDGFNDPAVYRPSTGEWFILRSSSGYTVFQQIQWGLSGDVPLTGTDFDGDGISDLTVYRPSNGTWFTKFSSTGYANSASQQWGVSGDVPVPGEYDGDGRTDHAVYRPSNGTWFILHSSTNQTTNASQQWGLSGDIPVPADFDGDRKTDVAIWRPASATWFFLSSSTNNSVFDQVQWGISSDIPILKRP